MIDKPGKYTVLVTKLFGFLGSRRIWLVARPLVIEVQKESPGATTSDVKHQAARPTYSPSANEPKDTEWTRLAAKAGQRIHGCVLESLASPITAGRADLVVSLMCEGAQ